MGMDVYGKNATTERGKYFRNNAWWWRPLWDYCHQIASDVISEALHKSGHYNDGAGLDAADSIRLATRLDAEIAGGRTAIFSNDYEARRNGEPDEECDLCEGTGVRHDAVGVAHKMAERLIDDPKNPRYGQRGYCNKCEGAGHLRPSSTHYPFSVENVQEFAAFLRECGGFTIF